MTAGGPHVVTALDDLYGRLDGLEGLTLYHRRPWHRVLERAFGWRVKALVDYDRDGRLALFLPFVEKRRLGRKVRVSLPLSHCIGPATRPGYRFSFPAWLAPFEAHAEIPGLEPHAEHVVTELDLTDITSDADLLAQFRGNDIRRRIDRAHGVGLTTSNGNRFDMAVTFAHLQAITRRRQGAPTYPRDFFPAMVEELAPIARFHLVSSRDEAVAGVVMLLHGKTAIYGYSASNNNAEARRCGANQLALWAALLDARDGGCTIVDFGSSPRTQPGLWHYKEQWGGITRPLVHSSLGIPPVAQYGALAKIGGAALRRLPLPIFEALSPSLMRAVL